MPADVALTHGHTFLLCDCIIMEDATPDGAENYLVAVELRFFFLPF